jgi:starch synthase
MKIVSVASEMVPYAKTGGLADVAGALPVELARLGHRVTAFLPLYREVARGGFDLEELPMALPVQVGERFPVARYAVHRPAPGVEVVFVGREEYFDREHLYRLPARDYDDNAERFIFFSKAVLAYVGDTGLEPDVIHCHDWQSALIPSLLHHGPSWRVVAPGARTLLTIHNLAYQGSFWAIDFPLTNLPPAAFQPDGLEFFGRLNLLKGGILTADQVSTVSRRYATEIQTPEFGCGLDGVLGVRSADLTGILNGIDVESWNPATDPHLPARYSVRNREGKKTCRRHLLEEFGLRAAEGTAVAGIVSRLTDQKGFDLLEEAMDDLLDLPVVLVVLGTGEEKYHCLFEELAERYPGSVGVRIAFDEGLARRIEAGSDIFLMPSRFEPCGLNQMYSLRYGTIPVVRATGGLDDTIEPFDAATREGNGFKFADYTADAFLAAVKEALSVFARPRIWSRLVSNAMAGDFSWAASAARYEALMRRKE